MAGHFEGKDPVEEISETCNVTLCRFHVQVDRPQIPSFSMRVYNAFEYRLATLWVA